MTELRGRHALVTGGGSGIGAAIALGLAGAGAKVTIAGRRREPLEGTAAGHASMRVVTGDVTDAAAVVVMVAEAAAANGTIDIAVAVAGASASIPFLKMKTADLQSLMDVNVTGTFHLWQAALGPMLDAGWGRLIAIASVTGLRGYPYISGYCASKHGVIGLMRALAQETAKSGVTVNAVCPGYVETPMLGQTIDNIVGKTGRSREEAAAAIRKLNPQDRFIQPEEVADTVLWLCGEGAMSITGQAISLSGGEV